jgi:Arc/MetJ-type ribon-helix-helix transcriptional regulator
MAKRILLSVPDQILKKLEAEKQKYAYSSLQEVVLEALRDRLFIEAEPTTETRGRPKKIREEKILTRKKIFSKKGEPISI